MHNRIKVDWWANGWMINGSGEITIFYWPQLLQYLGFVILVSQIASLLEAFLRRNRA